MTHPSRWRRLVGAGAALLVLAGCGSSNDNVINIRTDYLGTVIADDAQAATAGREMLLNRGNAADAAVAVAMTLALSLPSRAGLGGGGVCLVHAGDTPGAEALEFLPRQAAGGDIAIPGLVRGLGALQARYGMLRWQQTLAPAEKYAALGITAGPAFIADLTQTRLPLTRPDGTPLREGDPLKPGWTASVLSQLRLRGPAELYTGDLAEQLIRAGMPRADLAAYAPVWTVPLAIRVRSDMLQLAPTSAGRMAQAVWSALQENAARAKDPAARLALAHGAGAQALTALAGGAAVDAASDAGSTGFVVTDSFGGAVACSLTLGGVYGSGRTIGTLDVLAGAPVAPQSVAALSLAPMLSLNAERTQVASVFVASGSPGAAVDGTSAAYAGLVVEEPLDRVLADPRAAEEPAGGATVADRVHGMLCPGGLGSSPQNCVASRDPRGTATIFQVVK